MKMTSCGLDLVGNQLLAQTYLVLVPQCNPVPHLNLDHSSLKLQPQLRRLVPLLLAQPLSHLASPPAQRQLPLHPQHQLLPKLRPWTLQQLQIRLRRKLFVIIWRIGQRRLARPSHPLRKKL